MYDSQLLHTYNDTHGKVRVRGRGKVRVRVRIRASSRTKTIGSPSRPYGRDGERDGGREREMDTER